MKLESQNYAEEIEWFCRQNDILNDLDFQIFETYSEFKNWIFYHPYYQFRNHMARYFAVEDPNIGGACVDLRPFGGKITIFILRGSLRNWARPISELTVVFHELVHYRQYRTGLLLSNEQFQLQWRGPPNGSQPWELDAYVEQDYWSNLWLTLKNNRNTSKENTPWTLPDKLWIGSRKNTVLVHGLS